MWQQSARSSLIQGGSQFTFLNFEPFSTRMPRALSSIITTAAEVRGISLECFGDNRWDSRTSYSVKVVFRCPLPLCPFPPIPLLLFISRFERSPSLLLKFPPTPFMRPKIYRTIAQDHGVYHHYVTGKKRRPNPFYSYNVTGKTSFDSIDRRGIFFTSVTNEFLLICALV